jgi:hypothetical protein
MTEGIPPGGVIDDADTWDLPSLLRVRRERPRGRRAAEKRHELAPFPLMKVHPTPNKQRSGRS